jgi:hypothetical protein
LVEDRVALLEKGGADERTIQEYFRNAYISGINGGSIKVYLSEMDKVMKPYFPFGGTRGIDYRIINEIPEAVKKAKD